MMNKLTNESKEKFKRGRHTAYDMISYHKIYEIKINKNKK